MILFRLTELLPGTPSSTKSPSYIDCADSKFWFPGSSTDICLWPIPWGGVPKIPRDISYRWDIKAIKVKIYRGGARGCQKWGSVIGWTSSVKKFGTLKAGSFNSRSVRPNTLQTDPYLWSHPIKKQAHTLVNTSSKYDSHMLPNKTLLLTDIYYWKSLWK